jgi:hypothetical protein
MVNMVTNSNQNKQNNTKKVRILPLIGSILTLYLCFFAVIPLGIFSGLFSTTLTDIPLNILSINQFDYYIWGILDSGISVIDYSNLTLDALLPLGIWLIAVLAGVLGMVGSAYNEIPKKMKKLIKLAAVFLIIDLIYFILLNVFWMDIAVIRLGSGLYLMLICIILYILAAIRVTEYHEIP